MRNFKRWYRMRLYLLGRWLMHRYQKPLVFNERQFDDFGNELLCPSLVGKEMRSRAASFFQDSGSFGSAIDWHDREARMEANKTRNGRIKVPADKVLELVEGQPGEMVEPPHMSMVHLGPNEELPA